MLTCPILAPDYARFLSQHLDQFPGKQVAFANTVLMLLLHMVGHQFRPLFRFHEFQQRFVDRFAEGALFL